MTRRAGPALAVVVLAVVAATAVLVSDDRTTDGVGTTAACPLAPVTAPGGSTWRCTLDEEFDGTVLDRSVWTVERTPRTGYHSGDECFVDDPATVAVSGGSLVLTLDRAAAPAACGRRVTALRSGMVHTRGKVAPTYGRFEVRAALPAMPGVQPAVWLYPQTLTYGRWPRSGEIDIVEYFGDNRAAPHLHYAAPGGGRAAPGASCPVTRPGGGFHTYAVDWTARGLRFTYDGAVCWQVTTWAPDAPLAAPAPFDRPFFLLLTLAAGLGTNRPAQSMTYPVRMRVDFVHIWS